MKVKDDDKNGRGGEKKMFELSTEQIRKKITI